MARNTGSDYIPTEADLIKQAEERKAYMAAHPVKMNAYNIRYSMNGVQYGPEVVYARSNADAIEHFKNQCSIVGWVPYDLTCEEVK